MRYIFINDLCFLKQNKKLIVAYILVILLFTGLQSIIGITFNNDLLLQALGLNCTLYSGVLSIIMYILNISFGILITLILFNNDIKNGMSNIFMRMTFKKWFFIKLLSNLIITVILKLLIYILLFALCIINNFDLLDINIHLLLNIIFSFLYQVLFLTIYILLKKFKFIIPILLLILILNIKYLIISIIDIHNYVLFIIGSILILSVALLINIKNKSYIFE